MTGRRPNEQHPKRYPHFDQFISLKELDQIVTDPDRVASKAFYPFIRYTKRWRPFRYQRLPPKHKERPIRYASRRDAYIFSYYRRLLSQLYEQELERLGITQCPVAYRRLSMTDGNGRGKCNIDFMQDVVGHIRRLGNCVAIALDISSYFESIDHHRLKNLWCRLLQRDTLPSDHAAVFRAITNYAFVDRDELYKRLSYIGSKEVNGRTVQGYLRSYSEMPMQLCSPSEFRERVCGKSDSFDSLIRKNEETYGIP